MDESETDKTSALYFDEKTQTPQLKAIKAAIPFMEPSVGKKAAMMVKLLEMKIIMESFEDEIAIQAADADKGRLMLDAMRPYCGDDMSRIADFLDRADEMRRMAELLNAFNGADGGREF